MPSARDPSSRGDMTQSLLLDETKDTKQREAMWMETQRETARDRERDMLEF